MQKEDQIEDILKRGVEKIVDEDILRKKLLSGKKLRIKFGVDPTGPKIHIGRATQLLKLKDFQDLGHKIILIIGDFTALIGDASDKKALRPALSEKQIKENLKDYLNQIGKILNLKKTEIRYNSKWFSKLSIKELVNISMKFTAQQMIQRRNFKERWEEGTPIGLHELYYPLFQGYDSVVVNSDVEMGGYDQLFNIMTGRDLQQIYNQEPQDIIALKMIEGLDGRKMSTSWGNVINILDEPKEMFGKLMSLKDELMITYLETCTRIPLEEIKQIERDLKEEKVNPRNVKARLAKEITSIWHNKKEAEIAEEEFNNIFREKGVPEDIQEVIIKEEKLGIISTVTETGLAESRGEARRLIIQGGIKINDKVHNDPKEEIEIKKGMIIQAGKRKFAKIKR